MEASSRDAGSWPAADAPGYVFMIVGRHDTPLYERELPVPGPLPLRNPDGKPPVGPAALPLTNAPAFVPPFDWEPFILFAALDLVDNAAFANDQLYMKQVERLNDYVVSAYLTPGHTRFLLLYRSAATAPAAAQKAQAENVRQFFQAVHDHYLRVLMNPFYDVTSPIMTAAFDRGVMEAAGAHLAVGATRA